jgi:hypothetical protein
MNYYSYLLIRCESNSHLNDMPDSLYFTRTILFLPYCQGSL